MRILQVTPYFSPQMGGAAMIPHDIARQLGQRGHQVTVVTSDCALNAARFPQGPFELVVLPNWIERWGFYVNPALLDWTNKNLNRFDVVHLHTARTFQNIVTAWQARRQGKSYLLQAHGTLPVIMARQSAKLAYDFLFGRRILDHLTYALAVSEMEVMQYKAHGIPDTKIRRVPNGLDLETFAHLPPPGRFRQALGIAPEQPLVLFLGRLHPIKGLDHLVDTFARLLEEVPQAVLVLAGPDEGDQPRLQSLAQSLDISAAVRFPGGLYGEAKLSALTDATLLCYPSAYEIFGLVPFEAMLCGTPVVVTRESGMGEIIEAAGAGYLAGYGNQEQLLNALQQVLANPEAAQEKVRQGQTYIRAHLTWPVILHQLEAIYAECTATS